MSRVAVLKGGRSLERQISLQSGARVEDALGALGHEVIGIDTEQYVAKSPTLHKIVFRLQMSPISP